MNARSLAGGLFFLSGGAALVYQVAWQRILALTSGVSMYYGAEIVRIEVDGSSLALTPRHAENVALDLARHLRGGLSSLRLSAEGGPAIAYVLREVHREVPRPPHREIRPRVRSRTIERLPTQEDPE